MQTTELKTGIEQEYIDFIRKSDNRFTEIDCHIQSRKELTQKFDNHYICHTAWAVRVLVQLCPAKHVDIASSAYFNAMASAFIPIDFYDFRSWRLDIDNLKTGFEDIRKLTFEDNSISSLSCMHVVEHIGLGRYGECLEPNGDLRSIKELKRVLAPRGNLLFVVPVGRPKVIFNLHRIYSYDQIIGYFKDLKLVEFALIPDKIPGELIRNATKEMSDEQDYGCGCFWFRKD